MRRLMRGVMRGAMTTLMRGVTRIKKDIYIFYEKKFKSYDPPHEGGHENKKRHIWF